MKKQILLAFLLTATSLVFAQTPIDELEEDNLEYLEAREAEGYKFRTQIVTEFDVAHATQYVDLKLDENYEYLMVALGDSRIPGINLSVKQSRKIRELASDKINDPEGASYLISPLKSRKFKIAIEVEGLSAAGKGFVSFMVLRK